MVPSMDVASNLRVEEIHDFADRLTPAAKEVYANKYSNTIVEVFEGTASGEARRHYLFCQFFSVVASPSDKEEVISRVAEIFNKMVERNLIRGVLASAMTLPLAPTETGERMAVIFYPFPSLKLSKDAGGDFDKIREHLNKFLEMEAFVQEGRLGTGDWRNLPGGPVVTEVK